MLCKSYFTGGMFTLSSNVYTNAKYLIRQSEISASSDINISIKWIEVFIDVFVRFSSKDVLAARISFVHVFSHILYFCWSYASCDSLWRFQRLYFLFVNFLTLWLTMVVNASCIYTLVEHLLHYFFDVISKSFPTFV